MFIEKQPFDSYDSFCNKNYCILKIVELYHNFFIECFKVAVTNMKGYERFEVKLMKSLQFVAPFNVQLLKTFETMLIRGGKVKQLRTLMKIYLLEQWGMQTL